jgi:hypothetical protein
LRTVGDQRGGASGLEKAVRAEVIGVSKAGALAGENANAAADADALCGGLDDALVHTQGHGGDGLEVKIGELAASRKCLAKAAFE